MRAVTESTATTEVRFKSRLVPGISAAAFVALTALHPRHAVAQAAPASLTPPPGNTAYLTAQGVGTQDYICLPSAASANGTAWAFQHPQAALSVQAEGPFRLNIGRDTLSVLPGGNFSLEVAEHFQSAVPTTATVASPACTEAADGQHQYCPTWKSPHDQSEVWGTLVASIPAGSSPICPTAGSIACLLLKSSGNSAGQSKDGLFTNATFIQRTMTTGGATPAAPCTVGQIEFVPYTAQYTFYKPSE